MSFPANILRPLVLSMALLLLAASSSFGQGLSQKIDAEIAKAVADYDKKAAPLCSDLEFIRRVTLDLTGTIPTAEQARAFMKNTSPDKRAELVDALLKSPAHAWYFAMVLDVTWMERRADKHVPAANWKQYLRDSLLANKPYDVLVKEILSADGVDAKMRPAAKFYLEREGEPHLITRDISRLFLGANWQCAQCHDHPRIEDYKQDMYYGLFAFFNRSYMFTDAKTKQSVFAEKGEGDASFQSVFDTAKVTKSTGPKLFMRAAIVEPKLEKGKEYEVAPTKEVRGIPKFSRRAQLSNELARGDFAPFSRNGANRLWAHMMGRGIVHPLDMAHGDNPASHPALLELLGDEFVKSKFNHREILAQIARSKVYQRSSQLPKGLQDPKPEEYLVGAIRPLSEEQFAYAILQASGFTDAERLLLGAKVEEASLQAKLEPQATPIIKALATPAGQAPGYEARVEQALYLANNAQLQGLISPRKGSLSFRLAEIKDAGLFAEELYLGVLTRLPTEDEKKEVEKLLEGKKEAEKAGVIRDLVWALITSIEFRFQV
ncbi:MAG: DUF1549 domain-containing protein [Gemmataceae bacterium]